ncbi:cytochrome P450 9e2 [Tribolium castaneum]|uniref:cytochrome P450 9e2 n=1 Tax=Tribolium castaneum TaxID=7070 RepID=UPI00017587FD|nr:PREDICTED: cytochrome P450 9e2 isoform X1 [Tribolium castaneum]|eukprot:XP_015838491.1 PREDICTED: cytochrome P450 9e2 isoform X1 [Tribolium castaneum]
MLTTILLTLLSALIYFKLIKPASFWETRNVPHVTSWPLVGSMFPVLTQKKHFVEISQNIYTQFPNAKCVGYVLFTKPTLLIRDLDLLKQIGVKEFDSFHDHLPFVTEATEPLLSKSLLNLLGDEWRKMRATLSPAFTSSKMKHMYQLICECAERFTQHFGNRTVDVEIKDVFSRFSNDVIASAAFGIQVDSLKEPGNEFYSMGKAVTSILNGFQMVKVFLALSFPNIAKLIQFRAIPPKVTSFFYDIIIDNIKKRKNEGIVRPDMVHLLMEAQSGKLKHDNNTEQVDGFATVEESEIGKNSNKIQLTDELIVAQALIFLLAGFDSVSTGLSFIAYELATNPDVQKKLQEEIDSVLEKNQGKVMYNEIQSMKYLDQVLCETLRLWPPAPQTDRYCNKDFPIDANFTIEKGVMIEIPIFAIHRDPQYFADPDKFDPGRFSDENKSKIVPGTYIPFGVGPRNCIGSRFALLEIKILFWHLLSKFDILPNEKTVVPFKLCKRSSSLVPNEGIHLRFRPRK